MDYINIFAAITVPIAFGWIAYLDKYKKSGAAIIFVAIVSAVLNSAGFKNESLFAWGIIFILGLMTIISMFVNKNGVFTPRS